MLLNRALSFLAKAFHKRSYNNFIVHQHNAKITQEDLLHSLILQNQDTEFGKKHHFSAIKTIEDYQAKVPLQTWEDLSPYVDEIISGKDNILTKDPCIFFGHTSGTTGKQKMIPLTKEVANMRSRARRYWLYRALKSHPKLMHGKLFPIVNPGIHGTIGPNNIPFGAASGQIADEETCKMTTHLLAYAPGSLQVDDLEIRYYLAMRQAICQDVSLMMSANPTIIRKLYQLVEDNKDMLIKEIYDGTSMHIDHVPEEAREQFKHNIKANKKLAQKLEHAVNETEQLRPYDYWPNLALLACWTGGTVGIFANELLNWLPKQTKIRDLGFIATEGHFSVPIMDFSSAGLFTIEDIFYEFIEEEDFARKSYNAVLIDELEKGKNYQMVITAPNGLYRYVMNDIIKIDSYYNDLPLLKFLRKGKDVTNLAGEKLSVHHVASAIASISKQFNLQLKHYVYVADEKSNAYELHVEFNKTTPEDKCLAELLEEYNNALYKENHVFHRYIAAGAISNHTLHIMKPGWSEKLQNVKIKELGAEFNDAQYKPIYLTTSFTDHDLIDRTVSMH